MVVARQTGSRQHAFKLRGRRSRICERARRIREIRHDVEESGAGDMRGFVVRTAAAAPETGGSVVEMHRRVEHTKPGIIQMILQPFSAHERPREIVRHEFLFRGRVLSIVQTRHNRLSRVG